MGGADAGAVEGGGFRCGLWWGGGALALASHYALTIDCTGRRRCQVCCTLLSLLYL